MHQKMADTLTPSCARALLYPISVMLHTPLWSRDGTVFILHVMRLKLVQVEQLVQNHTMETEFRPSSLTYPL